MAAQLSGKIALITGSSSGLGPATAKRFIDEGAQVVITGRRQRELDLAVKELRSSAFGARGDVSNSTELGQLYERIAQVTVDGGRLGW